MRWCSSVICLFSFCFGVSLVYADCSRPSSLKAKEEYCWKEEIELVERIQQTSKSVLNFAKKKLGIGVEENREPQKCTYYQCQLMQLKLINPNGFPIYENFEKWIESEVIYEQAKNLLNQLNKCNEALSEATAADAIFEGDSVLNSTTSEVNIETPPTTPEPRKQTQCERTAEFIKCLSYQEGCAVFVYP